MRQILSGVFGLGVAMTLMAGVHLNAQGPEVTAKEGWVELPAAGETTASAFAVVRNPTMYDIYLVSAVSDVAGKVEFRKSGDGEAKAVAELTVPAYGKLTMRPDGVYLLLVDLTRPLQEDESVSLTLKTDGNVKLRIQAIVRKE
jgi:copper(I)-binding protein